MLAGATSWRFESSSGHQFKKTSEQSGVFWFLRLENAVLCTRSPRRALAGTSTRARFPGVGRGR
ncbi:hypothetical protein XAC3810_260063 [Xanthomonas citri pv. citri]|uniref:Uncharacterized protein n=1 Tax=Xanthomonas citri pv. citri TaxID=611301 RepID=A0A0U5FFG1_XANCI|nr:hypothetical protein XAC3824_270003 [Xanthomonas citri pv. citri]CEJ42287.1 hypothetical protein XAB3213_1460001 [Xanthomonas citri pv. bilvae]CEE21961.1 hypothetical protein XAC9322_260068 [Xanthomonas citri pv. citri]CEE23664.1 hypothetical protein XAC1083_260046 [Xanthomonas citri pv. citri]CEE31964.1 hypothetical protein XAC3810_260063 [Xanthomonas citri pv. citri]